MDDQALARVDRTLSLHACRIEHRIDDLAVGGREQYLIRCRCHSSSWTIWQPGDPPFTCPSTDPDVSPYPDDRTTPGLPTVS